MNTIFQFFYETVTFVKDISQHRQLMLSQFGASQVQEQSPLPQVYVPPSWHQPNLAHSQTRHSTQFNLCFAGHTASKHLSTVGSWQLHNWARLQKQLQQSNEKDLEQLSPQTPWEIKHFLINRTVTMMTRYIPMAMAKIAAVGSVQLSSPLSEAEELLSFIKN